jgi:hypothetical protein
MLVALQDPIQLVYTGSSDGIRCSRESRATRGLAISLARVYQMVIWEYWEILDSHVPERHRLTGMSAPSS